MISHQEINRPDDPAPYEHYYARLIEFYDGRAHWAASIQGVPLPAIHLFCVHWLDAEVGNGGFRQFFDNSTGVIAPEARDGFAAIGMPDVADLVSAAMRRLGEPFPFEREARQAILGDWTQDAASGKDGRPDFDDLDTAYYRLTEPFPMADGSQRLVTAMKRYAKDWHIGALDL